MILPFTLGSSAPEPGAAATEAVAAIPAGGYGLDASTVYRNGHRLVTAEMEGSTPSGSATTSRLFARKPLPPLSTKAQAVLAYIREHPGATAPEITRAFGFSSISAVRGRLLTLQAHDLIGEQRSLDANYRIRYYPEAISGAE